MDQSEPDWKQIVEDIGPCLYRYFCGVFSPAQASDLVQESLIRLVKKHRNGEYSQAKGSLKSYAFGIARFVRMEATKGGSGFDLVEDESELELPSNNQFGESDQIAYLRWAITQLKPLEQEIILLMIDAESSLDQIATALNIPIGTVKSHIHRAKENLRGIMEAKNEPQRR